MKSSIKLTEDSIVLEYYLKSLYFVEDLILGFGNPVRVEGISG